LILPSHFIIDWFSWSALAWRFRPQSSGKKTEQIEQTIKIDIKLKKNGTCLHLSPYIALQRKGGCNTDHSPNHIQAKFKVTQEILNLCDKLS
jgi:hypothetical protein